MWTVQHQLQTVPDLQQGSVPTDRPHGKMDACQNGVITLTFRSKNEAVQYVYVYFYILYVYFCILYFYLVFYYFKLWLNASAVESHISCKLGNI